MQLKCDRQTLVPQPPATTVEDLILRLTKEDGFDTDLLEVLRGADLCTLDNMSTETRLLWTGSTTSIPVLVPSLACWRPQCPTFEDVWAATSRVPRKGVFSA